MGEVYRIVKRIEQGAAPLEVGGALRLRLETEGSNFELRIANLKKQRAKNMKHGVIFVAARKPLPQFRKLGTKW